MKLQDLGVDKRWPWEPAAASGRASLTDFLNAAARQVALVRPDATAVTEPVRLEPGSLQRIPDPAVHGCAEKALKLLDVVRNLGQDGKRPGAPVTLATYAAMSALDWGRTGAVVENYSYDGRENPLVYHVFPAVPRARQVWVEVSFSAEPRPVSGPDDAFPLPSVFAGPVEHWMLYQIFSGDSSASNMGKAQFHMQGFYDSLGIKLQSDRTFGPRVGAEGVTA